MKFDAIEKILEDAAGLDSRSIGSNVVNRVVKYRMGAAGAANVEAYLARLKNDKNELQALIEDVTVPETWFFRDKTPFDLLSQLVHEEWMPPSKEKPLRILSMPCATGEEAYSIAMILRDLGFDGDTVRIDAVDISKRALERAEEAVYGLNSFRGDEGSYLHRFFEKMDNKFQVREPVRRMVRFRYGNLLDDAFMAGAELYEVIFCRNVMIYFTRELQDKAVKKLHRLLAVDGLLFVGHAETANLSGGPFVSLKYPGAFAFRKQPPAMPKGQPVTRLPRKAAVNAGDVVRAGADGAGQTRGGAKAVRRPPSKRMVKAPTESTSQTSAKTDGKAQSAMEDIRRMADEGHLKQAAALCEKYLEGDTSNAEAYYLLGLIREAEASDSDASNLFRKALYLNPHHYEALVHLAILAETQGNLAAAAVYRARASRLVKKDKVS